MPIVESELALLKVALKESGRLPGVSMGSGENEKGGTQLILRDTRGLGEDYIRTVVREVAQVTLRKELEEYDFSINLMRARSGDSWDIQK